MAEMDQVRLYKATPDATYGICGDVFVCIWRHRTTLEGVQIGAECFAEMLKDHPGGGWLITVVEEQAPLPGSQEREALAHWMNSVSASIRISALVFEGKGMRAAAVRSVVTGLNMLARQRFPHQVFSTVQDAVHWCFDELREPLQPNRRPLVLAKAIAKLRTMPKTE